MKIHCPNCGHAIGVPNGEYVDVPCPNCRAELAMCETDPQTQTFQVSCTPCLLYTPSARTFYRSVLTVEVLSEDPLPEGINLGTVAVEIVSGDCSGKVTEDLNQEVDGPTMAKLLKAQGSDPAFFHLNDDGEDEDEEDIPAEEDADA